MLIDIKQLETQKEIQKAARHQDKALRFISEKTGQLLDKQIGNLKMGESIHYATGARWSLHDLLVHCLKNTGPADVHLCFYAVKEYQARLLTKMQSEGLITNIHSLLYYRAAVNDPGAVQLLSAGSKTYGTMRTHAKLLVIRNSKWAVTIIGSANLTANTQSDVGIITCSQEISDSWIQWITKNINDATK